MLTSCRVDRRASIARQRARAYACLRRFDDARREVQRATDLTEDGTPERAYVLDGQVLLSSEAAAVRQMVETIDLQLAQTKMEMPSRVLSARVYAAYHLALHGLWQPAQDWLIDVEGLISSLGWTHVPLESTASALVDWHTGNWDRLIERAPAIDDELTRTDQVLYKWFVEAVLAEVRALRVVGWRGSQLAFRPRPHASWCDAREYARRIAAYELAGPGVLASLRLRADLHMIYTMRSIVVTGSASGIGRALCELAESRGGRVIDVDLHDASIVADLGTPDGRASMVDQVSRACGGTLDAVVANAGTTANPELCIRVNYFGAVATLARLRPLLERSPAPRAVATASSAVFLPSDADTVAACLNGDEEKAVELAEPLGVMAYAAAKRALARWVRRKAPAPEWAGAGIALNAVAPGVVDTPMSAALINDSSRRDGLARSVPMPFGGFADADHIAHALAFLTDESTERITGQVLFVDGGADATYRGDDVWQ